MDPSQWIAAFRIQHEHARRGTLKPEDLKKYQAMRDELARSLISAQGLTVPEATLPRHAFKVAHVFPIEIDNMYRTTTRELSCAGFTSLVNAPFKEGQQVSYSLTPARGAEPITGNARVVTALKQAGNTRISCTFEGMNEAKLERLELALFDAALSRIAI